MNIYEILVETAAKHPTRSALYYEGKHWTYRQLIKEIDLAAQKMVGLGIRAGEVIAQCMPNCPSSVFIFYATAKLGAISYLIHPLSPAKQIIKFMEKSRSKKIFILNVFSSLLTASLHRQGYQVIAVNPYARVSLLKSALALIKSKGNHHAQSFFFASKGKISLAKRGDEQTAVYLNSGGTSGDPKIIELSSKAINALALEGLNIVGSDDPGVFKMLAVLPLFHGFGLCMGLHAPLVLGGQATLLTKFKAPVVNKLIIKNEVKIIIGVPTLFTALLNSEGFAGPHLKNLVVAYIGGDSVPQSLLDRFNTLMEQYNSSARLLEGYGLTETVTVNAVNTLANNRLHSAGKPLAIIDIKILDLDTHREVGPGELGEIAVTGSTMMNGYLYDEETTAQTFYEIPDAGKYILTKDIGYLDKDGYLFFRQRIKRIIKVNGINVFPTDIERIVLNFPEVYEAYVIGITDPRLGYIARLFLSLNKDYKEVSQDELKAKIIGKIKEEMPIYALPKDIIILDNLPKTSVGKIDLTKLTDYDKNH
ncbi:MAG TPA: class I adenylate-forming enzyme family protein [Bacilli bacterium]|nr:class I adenylate-forming enzyme family protein [Bacilli bacterium]